MKKTQRLLATAMTPLLILHCLLTPLSVWADSLPVQPESTDYSNSAASSSEDESFVLNDEQQGVEVEQPTVSDNDSPSSVSSESASNATDSPKPENDVSAVFGSVSYQTHVQDIGWQAPVSNGMTAGTTGRAKRVEASRSICFHKMAPLWGMTAFRSNHTFPGSAGSLSRWVTGRHLEQLDSREPSKRSSYLCRAVFLTRMTFGIAFILQMLVGLAGPQMVSLLEHRAMLIRSKLFR